MAFTAEELEEMRLADEEIERNWKETPEDYRQNMAASRELDRLIKLDRLDNKAKGAKRKTAEYQRQYREANRDAIAEYYRQYYKANRDRILARQREQRQKGKDKKKTALDAATPRADTGETGNAKYCTSSITQGEEKCKR